MISCRVGGRPLPLSGLPLRVWQLLQTLLHSRAYAHLQMQDSTCMHCPCSSGCISKAAACAGVGMHRAREYVSVVSGPARYLHSACPAVVRGRGAARIHGALVLCRGKGGHHSGGAIWAGLQLCLCAILGHQDAPFYLQNETSLSGGRLHFVCLSGSLAAIHPPFCVLMASGLAICPRRIQTPMDSSLWSCKAGWAEEVSRRANDKASHPV